MKGIVTSPGVNGDPVKLKVDTGADVTESHHQWLSLVTWKSYCRLV